MDEQVFNMISEAVDKAQAKEKLLFVYNRHSGRGLSGNTAMNMVDVFNRAGFVVTMAPTNPEIGTFDLDEEEIKAFRRIICYGGDGTLSNTVHRLYKMGVLQDIELGYIPAGSTNDFGRSLGIPTEIMKAAKNACLPESHRVDLGLINGKAFVYVAAFGLFTEVSYATDQKLKNTLGHAAYLLEAAKSIGDIREYRLRVQYEIPMDLQTSINGNSAEGSDNLTTGKNETKEITGDFIFGMISNSTQVGGFKELVGEGADMNDGLFELVLIKSITNPEDIGRAAESLVNPEVHFDGIIRARASRIMVESAIPMPWTRDGEFGGNLKKTLVEVVESGIRVVYSK